MGTPKDGGGTGHPKDGLGIEGRNRRPQRMEGGTEWGNRGTQRIEGKEGTLKERNRGPQRMEGKEGILKDGWKGIGNPKG